MGVSIFEIDLYVIFKRSKVTPTVSSYILSKSYNFYLKHFFLRSKIKKIIGGGTLKWDTLYMYMRPFFFVKSAIHLFKIILDVEKPLCTKL